VTQADKVVGAAGRGGGNAVAGSRAAGFDSAAILDQATALGYARVRLTGDDQDAHALLRSEATRFFARDEKEKLGYACPEFHYGFRPYGRQYSGTPDRPDLNESFAYWFDKPELVPGHETIGSLLAAMHDYWEVLAVLSGSVLSGVASRFGSDWTIGFEGATHLEANSYFGGADRDLLQDRHEDGHLFTIVSSDGPGLEIEVNGRMEPFGFAEDELILMPGSLMTALTGGWLPPLYHQVRNHRIAGRLSLLYIVNLEIDGPVEPLAVGADNQDVDLRASARRNALRFGLPEAPI
jgi:isopenicillin N synthase-like dioxygenase